MPTGDSGLPVGHGRRADDLLALKRPSTDVSKWPIPLKNSMNRGALGQS